MYLLGVDYREYRKMFPGNIAAIEGRLLKDNERDVLIPAHNREQAYISMNVCLCPRSANWWRPISRMTPGSTGRSCW
jgi:hypothetical protein